jgi:hypothetical protein
MAAIFEDIAISYHGKTYTIKPTFELINKIEQSRVSGGLGISLAGLTARASRGDVPVSEVARIICHILRTAEVSVSDEDMYVEIISSDKPMQYIDAVTTAFFPVVRPKVATGDSKKK